MKTLTDRKMNHRTEVSGKTNYSAHCLDLSVDMSMENTLVHHKICSLPLKIHHSIFILTELTDHLERYSTFSLPTAPLR